MTIMTEVVYLALLLFMFIPAYVLMQHDDWDDEATTARIQRAAARCWRWLAALLTISFILSAVFYYQLSSFSLCFGGSIMALAAWKLWSYRLALRSTPHDESPNDREA